MLKVGLTGGIGSGKTFVAEIMKAHGIPVFDADSEAKSLYNDPQIIAEVAAIFGDDVLEDGKVILKIISQKAFADKNLLSKLNNLIHPIVRQNFIKWAESQKSDFAVMESAIFFETGLYKMMDKMITVDAPEDVRFERIRRRNPNWSESEIRRRMASQMPQSEKCRLADFIITNDGTADVESQVLKIKSLL